MGWNRVDPPSAPRDRRAKLEADLAAYLARGGKVNVVPQGATTDSDHARKVLGLASNKSRPRKGKKRSNYGKDHAHRSE